MRCNSCTPAVTHQKKHEGQPAPSSVYLCIAGQKSEHKLNECERMWPGEHIAFSAVQPSQQCGVSYEISC